MPSSQYVYADDANQQSGSMPNNNNRRRSQRIRRSTMEKASNLDDTVDPDETILEEDKDETILLSDEEIEIEPIGPPMKSDAMDVDEHQFQFAGNDYGAANHHHHNSTQASSSTGIPMGIRGGAEGFLSNDPLTSSTMASPPFSAIRANKARANDRMNTKERIKHIADQFGSDESDDEDMDDEQFFQAVARKQAQRQAMLAESQQQQQKNETQQQKSFASSFRNESQKQQQQTSFASSFRQNESQQHPRTQQQKSFASSSRQNDESLETQQQQQQQQNSNSEDTARIANHGEQPSTIENQSFSESFAATQPWEKELSSLPTFQQNAPQKDTRRQEYHPIHQAPQKDNRMQEEHHRQSNNQERQPSTTAPQINHRSRQEYEHQSSSNQGRQSSTTTQTNHRSLPSHPQNAPQKDNRRQEYEPNCQEKQASSKAQPNHQREHHRQTSNVQTNHPQKGAAISAVANPYDRKQPPPPPAKKNAPVNVPKISLEHLKSGKKSNSSRNRTNSSRGDTSNNSSITSSDEETWQEEAFRSSLLELLGTFPSNYFDNQDGDQDESMDGHNNSLFATSATENIDDQSPHSTTSQSAASAQLNRKRLFDAASRSLARLAIASRHSASDNRNRSGRNNDESPDFNPPSPRSLPAYMSVLNVHDDSSPGSSSGHWGAGNANAIFSGHSVHGRNARSVHLSSVPPQGGNEPSSSNPYSSWTSEQLAYGSMVLAAQVCQEASCDPNFESGKHSGEAESCRVAGFVQNTISGAKGNEKRRPAVSSALVESSLGFLATACACCESDLIYSVLKSNLKASDVQIVTVFDALSHFAPVSSRDASAEDVCTIPALSLLALSRGLEAVLHVARYATSLDPSSACAAYSSPHHSCGVNTNGTIDIGIDEGGVGWLSAVGRGLGLKLEDVRNSRPRHMHLSEIAGYCYDFILEYNPMLVDEATDSLHGRSVRDERIGGQRRGDSRGGLHIDTHAGQGTTSQGMDALVCRQPSVMKDRVYASTVEYLSSMINAGIVSGWLTSVPSSEGGDVNEFNHCDRTVERLCQKLFFVIETRSRLRRSTNQNTATTDPGDSEAVCAASLSLLILALPEHVNQSAPSSLSTSFRQMGNSTGSIEDLLHSSLIRKLVEMALSWQKNSKDDNTVMKCRATSNAVFVLSDICMVGGSPLLSSHFRQRLDGFLQNIVESICLRGQSGTDNHFFDNSSIDSSLVFLLQLHTGSPILVRQFLRNFIEQSSASSGDDCAALFVGGLLHLAANKSFSVSSCASSLLRALIDGNPVDRTQDLLSELVLNSFDTEQVGATIEDVIRCLVESSYESVHGDIPQFYSRWHPRMCFLGDLLGVCIPSINAINIFATLSDEVLSLLVDDSEHNLFVDTLCGSVKLSLLFLFASFANNGAAISNNENGRLVITQQRNVKEKLTRASGCLRVLEVAMLQGTSADMTYRALKLQGSMLSLSDDHALALTFTKGSNSVARKESALRDKLAKSEMDLNDMTQKYQRLESDRDSLKNSFHDQRLAYERRLEWTRSEARMTARHISEIHVNERKQAELRYNEEHELRTKAEHANEQWTCESSSDKSRIKELEELLGQERKSRQEFESAFGRCQNELSSTSDELESASNACAGLQEKLSTSEEKVSDLTATSEDAQANLEDTCEKLIRLATIYQNKESEMDKYKAELRSAVNTANRHADTAIQKYESAKQQNKLLSKKLEEASSELKDIKARKADVQRMRKNAPVAYLNQLHKDPRIQEKKQSRRERTGKENDSRSQRR